MYSHSLMFTPDMMPPMVPASSPIDRLYFAPFAIGISPSSFTVVGPPEVSAALPMFGYGIGMGGAGGAGVLQTSGKTMLMPPEPLWSAPRKFTKTVVGIVRRFEA